MGGELKSDGTLRVGDGTRTAVDSFHDFFDTYRRYMHVDVPDILPLDAEHIPIPNDDLLPRLMHVPITTDRIIPRVYSVPGGFYKMIPVFPTDRGDEVFIKKINVKNFRGRLWEKNIYSSEDLELMRRQYAWTAAITFGTDAGFHSARILQARTIWETHKMKGRDFFGLNEYLTKHFGIDLSPDEYKKIFQKIDWCLQDSTSESLAQARDITKDQPDVFLAYLIDKITHYTQVLSEEKDEGIIDDIEALTLIAQEANVGRLTDKDTYVNANINMAIVTLKELGTASKFPYAFALANEVLTRKTHLLHGSRLNSLFPTRLHDGFAIREGLVALSTLENGSVVGRGNVKSASSLITEVLHGNEPIREEIYHVAKSIGLSIDSEHKTLAPLTGIRRARHALSVFNAIMQYADEHQLKNEDIIRIQILVHTVVNRMENQNELIRSRYYFEDIRDLNAAVETSRRIIASYPENVRGINPAGIKGWAFAAFDTPTEHAAKAYTLDEIRRFYENDTRYASNFTADMLRVTPDDACVIILYYLHVPCTMDIDSSGIKLERIKPEKLLGMDPDQIVWVEQQYAMESIERVANMRRFVYERRDQGIQDLARFPQELNARLLQQAKSASAASDTRQPGEKKSWPIKYTKV